MPNLTIADKLDINGGRPSGFDYLRVILSLGVIAWHSMPVCYGLNSISAKTLPGPLLWPGMFIVPSFFALSGFLVAGSLERNNLASFLTLRALRIFPALIVEVLISAIVIGSLVTTLPFKEYIASPKFWRYFLNVIGDIHFSLPGVFSGLPFPNMVNLQLWTVPFELECYVLISLLALLKLHRRVMLFMVLAIALSIFFVFAKITSGHLPLLDHNPPGRMIVLCFVFGVAFYGLRRRIVLNWTFFVAAVIAVFFLISARESIFLAPLPIAYITIFLGLQNPKRTVVIAGADYSYGIYLYGFPIQQLIAYLFPWTRVWGLNFLLAVAATAVFAALSWHLVESRVLGHRKAALSFVRQTILRIPRPGALMKNAERKT